MKGIIAHSDQLRALKIAFIVAGLTSAGCIAAASVDPTALDWRNITKDAQPDAVAAVGYPIVAGGGSPPALALNVYTDGTNVEVDGRVTLTSILGTYGLQSPSAGAGTVLKYGDAGLLANSDNLALTNPAANGDLLFLTSPGGGGINEELRMIIDGATGNVGIGTASPGAALEVDGDVAASGDITHENADGETRVLITDGGLGSDAGFIRTDGPNGTNVLITNVSGFPDYGFVGVYDANTTQAFMSVDTSGDGNVSSDYSHLVPQASPPPGGASNGSIYYDSSHALCVRLNGAWVRIAGGGNCS